MMIIDEMSTSRLIIKNLPNTATKEKLRDLFSQKGAVTDVKLKFSPEGKFRHFAFVGYRTNEEAEEARQYFDKTFVGASRICVELCQSLGEKPIPAAKAARDKLKAEKLQQKKLSDDAKPTKRKRQEDDILEKCEQDPAFMEFLQAHKKSASSWGNDSLVDELMKMKDKLKKGGVDGEAKPKAEGEPEPEGQPSKKKSKKSKDTKAKAPAPPDDTEDDGSLALKEKSKKPMKEFFTLKLRDVPKRAKKKDIKSFFAPLKPKSIRFPKGFRGIVFVGFGTEEDQIKGLQKNKSFLLGNQVRMRTHSSKDEMEESKKAGKWRKQEEDLEQNAEAISESGRIFLRNLSYTTNEDEVTKLFEKFGPITEVHLPLDRISRKLKGIGFVTFMLPEHANQAFKTLDGTIFQGRVLHLLPSKSKDELAAEDMNAGSSYKTEKAKELKKSAGSSTNWNSLFLGTDAISKVISQKYGVSREEMLLDRNDEHDHKLASAGVRMALAETEIVSDTKRFLEENGVCLEAFDSSSKKAERSKTAVLVKNLPAGTTADDIKDVFLKHGVLNRIVLPPSGVTGIVEFAEPAEARAAFKNLAYTKFFHLPLYLEWAPVGVFSSPVRQEDARKLKLEAEALSKNNVSSIDQTTAITEKLLQQTEDFEPVDENAVPELDTSLFVKNLNFRTVEEPLKKHFIQCGPVYAVTVARKKDPSNPDMLLSMGYGFVQYYRSKDAEKALKTLNGTMLENHILELKRSTRSLVKETHQEGTKKKGPGTKLLIRNIPFQATQEEITDLFKTFGKLKAVRLPKKLTGSGEHRGFAFVEYYSENDSKKAFETLCKSTHLYGRRLVLEWAAQDESVDDLRAKTARLISATRGVTSEDSSQGGSTKQKLQRYFKSHPSSQTTAEDDDEDGD